MSIMRPIHSLSTSTTKSLYSLPVSLRHAILRSSPSQSTTLTRLAHSHAHTATSPSQIIKPLVPPPDARSGPLLSRRPDRELPDVRNKRTWLKTLPIFIALITVSSLAIFNYQKSSSSTVNSVLYALRTNSAVRELLGDEIYFAAKVPWIRGELNQLHGNINISFWVKGTKGMAQTKFVSVRKKRNGYFETLEWSLKTEDGRVIQLLDLEGAKDPMDQVVKE